MNSRRNFLKTASIVGAGLAAAGSSMAVDKTPRKAFSIPRPKIAGPIRIAYIGLGQRGRWHVKLPLAIGGVEVKAFADPRPENLVEKIKYCTEAGVPKPDLYTNGVNDYKNMIKRDDIDIVVIATPWEFHVQQAVDCMKAGKHVFIEVPAAVTLQECWDLVDTSESTGMHCMMMENCCYGNGEMRMLGAVAKGEYGKITHGTGAYIHHLSHQIKSCSKGEGLWRPDHWASRNGNLYPTHGLGPVAQYMGINRGDQFEYITSMSSPSHVRTEMAKNLPKGNRFRNVKFKCGDMNTSNIKTKQGRSIVIDFDTATHLKYSRRLHLQGTKAAGVIGDTHPLWNKLKSASKGSGHGGMDYMMWWRIIHCLKNGLQLDQDVYDAAAWSAVGPLSEESVAKNGMPIKFPDFTRGNWHKREMLKIEVDA